MTKRRKLGRPSLGVNARTEIVQVKYNAAELAAIKAAVAAENAQLACDGATGEDAHRTTVSSWIRDHSLDPLGLMSRSSHD